MTPKKNRPNPSAGLSRTAPKTAIDLARFCDRRIANYAGTRGVISAARHYGIEVSSVIAAVEGARGEID